MIAGTSNNLIKIHDYVLSMGYKTSYPDDWHNFMYRSDVRRCDMYLQIDNLFHLRFYIVQMLSGKFELDFDVINRDNSYKVFDTARPELKYITRWINVLFDEANWEEIKAIISNNRRIAKEIIVNDKIETIKTDFV